MKKIVFLLLLFNSYHASSQSFEMIIGNKRVFTDLQWSKNFDESARFSLFSRARASVDYDNNTNLFLGEYISYTLKNGFGFTVVGKIKTTGGEVDTGIHFKKKGKNCFFLGLASIGIRKGLDYSWFSIFRYNPKLTNQLKLATSIELFTLFREHTHLGSVQRIRLGILIKDYQIGVASNISEIGSSLKVTTNLGVYLKKNFN